VDIKERDCRILEEDVCGSLSCTMVVDTIDVLTFSSDDAISQLRGEVKVEKNNWTTLLLNNPMCMMRIEGKIKKTDYSFVMNCV